MKEVMEMAMQELAQIAAAEEQARAICEQARAEAAELAVQAEKGRHSPSERRDIRRAGAYARGEAAGRKAGSGI